MGGAGIWLFSRNGRIAFAQLRYYEGSEASGTDSMPDPTRMHPTHAVPLLAAPADGRGRQVNKKRSPHGQHTPIPHRAFTRRCAGHTLRLRPMDMLHDLASPNRF